MKTVRALRTTLAAAGLASLAACLIFPTPEMSEIRDSRIEFIQPGNTTRQELEAELTSRDVFLARISPPYSIYAEYRDSFGIAVFGPESGDGQVFGNVDDYLVVEYDNADRVVRYDRLRKEGECTSYGLCVSGGSEPARKEASRKDPLSLIVFAPTVDDAARKEFDPAAGTCSVYAYTSGRRGCNNEAVDVINLAPRMVPSRPTRANSGGFFHWTVPVIGRSPVEGTLSARPVEGSQYDHRYECVDGGLVFVEVRLTSCGIGAPWVEFHPATQSAGQAEIALRRLILP